MDKRVLYKVTSIAGLAVALCACAARADEPAAPTFSFSGFGTLGVVHSSEPKADFVATTFKPNGAGFSHVWSTDVDSLIAAQASANFSPQISGILQIVSEQLYDNTYRPHVEWASLKYQFSPDFSVRVGRTALPTFMVTDSRKVGYANPWLRPPVEVYNLVSVTSNDGVDASYRVSIGAATNTFQVTAGQSDSKFPAVGGAGIATAKAREQVSFVDTIERGSATVRFSYGQTRLTIPELDPLFDAFRQFGSEGMAIADKYDVNKRLVTFIGVGASYDPGDWFVMGEWGRVNTRSVFGQDTGWYVSGGYRIADFTPYVTYAQLKSNSVTSDPGLTVANLPPALAGPATGLNAALNGLLSARAAQDTVSIGGRWDFMPKAALKLQLDHSRHAAESAGTLVNVQPGFQPGGNVNVFSVVIDFVF